jgi:large subunit ribosomal protein L15
MQLNQISPPSKSKNRKRVGRGGKRGTYSGRGLKGQKSRAGARLRPAWRDLIKKIPKKRGFKFQSIYKKPFAVNIFGLEENFKSGEIVSPKELLERGLVFKSGGRLPEIKILGSGKLKKKLIIKDCLISKVAKDKIEKAGGQIR